MRTVILVVVTLSLVGCASVAREQKIGLILFPKEVLVPAVGSTTIKQLTRDGKTRPPEIMLVHEHQSGRPIFVGKVWSYEGSMAETENGSVVWAKDCPTPPELASVPVVPNKCDWTVCYPPQQGTTYLQSVRFYVPLLACTARDGMLSVTTVGEVQIPVYGRVVHTQAQLTVPGLPGVTWQSYIKPGFGEVYAQSVNWVSVYENTPKRRSIPYRKSPAYSGGRAVAQSNE